MSPEQRAEAALVAVLETQWRREPAIVLDSPRAPGKPTSPNGWPCRASACLASA